jgi:hypothetical protein
MADLLRHVDIANRLGVSKQRAHQLAHHVNFPPPVQHILGVRFGGSPTFQSGLSSIRSGIVGGVGDD